MNIKLDLNSCKIYNLVFTYDKIKVSDDKYNDELSLLETTYKDTLKYYEEVKTALVKHMTPSMIIKCMS